MLMKSLEKKHHAIFVTLSSVFTIPRNVFLLFVVIFLIKICTGYYLHYLATCERPEIKISTLAIAGGDTFSYTGAMENYFNTGKYYFFNGKENVYAGRMPHYSIPYYFFRLFLNQNQSYNALIIFQLVMESFSIVLFSMLIFKITQSASIGFASIIIQIFNLSTTHYSIQATPESLSISLLIIITYLIYTYYHNRKFTSLLFISFLLAWLTCLKPYFIILYPIVVLTFCSIYFGYENIKKVSRLSITLIFPLLIFILPWVIRNEIVLNKFIPLQISVRAGYNYTKSELSLKRLIHAWGENSHFWEPKSVGCLFSPYAEGPCDYLLPEDIYTKKYTKEDIERLIIRFKNLIQNPSSEEDSLLENTIEGYRTAFIEENTVRFYFLSPMERIKNCMVHSGSYYLPISSSFACYKSYQFLIKFVQSCIYWFSLLVGLPMLFMLVIKSKQYLFMLFIPVYLILLFPISFGLQELRYFHGAFPFFLFGSILFVHKFLIKIVKLKSI